MRRSRKRRPGLVVAMNVAPKGLKGRNIRGSRRSDDVIARCYALSGPSGQRTHLTASYELAPNLIHRTSKLVGVSPFALVTFSHSLCLQGNALSIARLDLHAILGSIVAGLGRLLCGLISAVYVALIVFRHTE